MENSPIYRLPPELLNDIFLRCLPIKANFKPGSAPLLLTHVCRVWRTAALACPRLWTHIEVPDWQEAGPHVADLVELWLARAGSSAPLDIDIAMFDQDVQLFPTEEETATLYATLARMIDAFQPHRNRVHKFRGVFPESFMPAIGVGEMVNAEGIFCCGLLSDDMNEQNELPQMKLDLGPPRSGLRSLAICGCAANLQSISLQTQLTHIELIDLLPGGDLCQEAALELLSLPNLKSAVLDLSKYDKPDLRPPEERLVLTSLEILFVTWSFPADVSVLLDGVAAPKLTRLGLRGTPVTVQEPWQSLRAFLAASRATLQRLSLGDFSFIEIQLLDCLRQCPELVHLAINHTSIPDTVLHALTCTDDAWEMQLLPKLQILSIGVCSGFIVDSLTRFLKSRSTDVPPGISELDEVAIIYCDDITVRTRPLLEACGIKNLVLEVVDNDPVYPYARVVETHRELLSLLYELDTSEDLEDLENSEVLGETEGAEDEEENG
ncbi:hypothetical protein EW145_g2534 [Phellinidium pouzarii]|uniref:Uncharacterized protein n=1 Tax=Phellinidium pouzarii TaxID=167371 RepID=A0A4V3XD78_9AGAM|nr:hypothetical protein EW145_g2534 [Phellinidium pouzarii]